MYPWMDKWEDYYRILGISRAATPAQIKSAWKGKLRKNHPDNVPPELDEEFGKLAEERSKKINQAHDTLSDFVAKTDYDQEYDKHHSGSSSSTRAKASSTTSSGSSSGSTGSGSSAGNSTPPPKSYNPVVEVSQTDVSLNVEEGETASFSFTVNHISGDLPPKWALGIKIVDGKFLDSASINMNPKDSFPTLVSVKLPPQAVGDYLGSVEVSVIELS